ncbi:MAG TPA: methyltransferase domain-containing protein [Aridibacter sp.]|nr:methyltransferase domain-containing protein [Aridibacter sp.]
MPDKKKIVEHYDAQYSGFATELYSAIRQEVFGIDYGQNGWQTVDEQDRILDWLKLDGSCRLLDVACGSGGPAMRIAESTLCAVTGIDINEKAIREAVSASARKSLDDRAKFRLVDGSTKLPFEDSTFDALTCIDAVNHLPDRSAAFSEWHRVLGPGGRLAVTDPIVITGPVTDEEMRIRSSIGFFIFVPPNEDERLLVEAGFRIESVDDVTGNMASIADKWKKARAGRERQLREIEGNETFDGQQTFFEMAARLAAERRLSRLLILAERP